MADQGQSPKEHCWRAEGMPLAVEYAPEAIRTIVHDVEAAFRMFPHGGLAVGGVLFGEAGGDRIRIVTSRPIHCDHSAGPSFTLSDDDHRRLEEQLRDAAQDAGLGGLVPVGWYHSHTRSGVNLTPSDLELHQRHFPKPWQAAIVLRPEEDRPTKLGIFVRDAEGRMPARPALVLEAPRGAANRGPAPEPPPVLPGNEERAAAPQAQGGGPSPPRPLPAPSFQLAGGRDAHSGGWRKWALGGIVAAAIGAGLWIGAQNAGRAQSQSGIRPVMEAAGAYLEGVEEYWAERLQLTGELKLRAVASGSSLLIRWDPGAPEFRGAAGGELRITDGASTARIKLDLMELMQGAYTYAPLTHDVRIELAVHHLNAPPAVVGTRYLRAARPAGATAEATPATPEELRLELERLRTAVALEREQTAALTRTLSVLDEFEQQQAARRSPAAPEPAAPQPGGAAAAAGPEATPAAAAPATPAKPPAPPVELAQNPPAIDLQQQGAALSAGAAQPAAPAPEPSARPAAAGPPSGKLIWTGFLRAGETLTIEGGRASTGNVTGRLPGVAVEISVYPAEFTSSGLTAYTAQQPAPPAAGLSAAGLSFQYDPGKAAGVELIEKPSEANQWRRVRVRAAGRPAPAVVIVWRRAE